MVWIMWVLITASDGDLDAIPMGTYETPQECATRSREWHSPMNQRFQKRFGPVFKHLELLCEPTPAKTYA